MNIYYFLSDLSIIISRTIPLHYLNSCDSNGDENEDPLLHTHTHTHTHNQAFYIRWTFKIILPWVKWMVQGGTYNWGQSLFLRLLHTQWDMSLTKLRHSYKPESSWKEWDVAGVSLTTWIECTLSQRQEVNGANHLNFPVMRENTVQYFFHKLIGVDILSLV